MKDLVLSSRTCRRFHQDAAISRDTLLSLIELARLSASGSNLQPIRYVLSCEPEKNEQIFPLLKWAGYLKDWPGPVEGERPAAYIIILGDTRVSRSFSYDVGIVAQTLRLGATEKGLAGCMIGSIQRQRLRKLLDIPEEYEIPLVLALGKPREKAVLEHVGPSGDVKYWRDAQGVHHVPKRALESLIISG
jgi:nitroreductase